MTVINPSSISGITSITMPSGDGNVLTVHTNDGVERFRIDSSGNVKVGSACTISQDGDVFFTGVTTATTFTGAHSGSGANLTSLPAAQLTGALPAISGADPCTGSYKPKPPSPRLADGSIPKDPVIIAASSDNISPNMLPVTITSKRAGSRTRSIAQESTS